MKDLHDVIVNFMVDTNGEVDSNSLATIIKDHFYVAPKEMDENEPPKHILLGELKKMLIREIKDSSENEEDPFFISWAKEKGILISRIRAINILEFLELLEYNSSFLTDKIIQKRAHEYAQQFFKVDDDSEESIAYYAYLNALKYMRDEFRPMAIVNK